MTEPVEGIDYGLVTEADIAMLRHAMTGGVKDTDFRELYLTDLDDVVEELGIEEDGTCHCGAPVTYGYDGDPTHHRGMCADCDRVRCDAYPGECR